MNLTLTWDLFISFFFAVVTAYSFIVGKRQVLIILMAVAIAILATQGFGNLLLRLTTMESASLTRIFGVLGIPLTVSSVSVAKLILFLLAVVAMALKGGFNVEESGGHSSAITLLATGLFGFATAGLIVIALLTFAAGAPLLDPALSSQAMLQPLMANSRLVTMMVQYQDLWFSFPAVLLIGFGFIKKNDE